MKSARGAGMNDYQLLDFGAGRKLERFGPYVLDRPSPAAEGVSLAAPELWRNAHARFVRAETFPCGRVSPRLGSCSSLGETRPHDGHWELLRDLPESWTVAFGRVVMDVRLTPFGHVGVFPEQVENWRWIAEQAIQGSHLGESLRDSSTCKVLNLFAYTGGSTLAAAAAGSEVTHIDAAKNIVAWARRNAKLSGLAAAPIRWIAEDARKFVARELRRGNRYDAVILDPPSYGHGPKGEAWRIDEHLLPLLKDCARLTAEQCAFFLLTCHTPGYDAAELASLLTQAGIAASTSEVETMALQLAACDGRTLPGGAAARWVRKREV